MKRDSEKRKRLKSRKQLDKYSNEAIRYSGDSEHHSDPQTVLLAYLKKAGRGWHGGTVELEPALGFGEWLIQGN